MALGTTTNRIVYAGNGSTTQFAFPYYYLATSHVKVVLVLADESEQPQSETTHYTITEPAESGGTVTMLAAPAADQKLVIYREVPLTQEFEPVEGGALPAAELEKAIDKAFMVLQQLQDAISRSIVLSPATGFANLRIPDPEPAKYLGWNGEGDGLVNLEIGDPGMLGLTDLAKTLCAQATADGMAGLILAPGVKPSGSGFELANPFRKNFIINGGCEAAQRVGAGGSVSVTASGALLMAVDRFGASIASGMTAAGTLSHHASAPAGLFGHCCRFNITSFDAAIAASDRVRIRYVIEGYDVRRLMGRKVTIGFWVRATITGTYCIAFRNNGPDRSYVAEFSINAADTWEFKWVAFTMDTGAVGAWDFINGYGLIIDWALACGATGQTAKDQWMTGDFIATANQVNGVASANDFRIRDVQLELGGQPTEFEFLPIDKIISLCERYYETSYDFNVAPGTASSNGANRFRLTALPSATYGVAVTAPFKVRKRAVPTVTPYSPDNGASGKAYDATSTAANVDASAVQIGESGCNLNATLSASKTAADVRAHWVADAELS